MEDLQQVLQAVHDETLARNEQLMDTHQRNAVTHYELSTSLKSSLESLVQGDISRLSQSVSGFDSMLASGLS